ncbi:UPF0158 family protein [Oceanobacillus neutriphilus]|uniref:Uncharacterized protein n=1 Tax=Oceanobacillus neutriphilus TaxID=531815 RepID=A0ABQ2NP46_9BACI|nr:UPF0158 family protein [Oceanobacillus neutriphilus]GGP08253.1 hypothetical protein GCM10011346_07560 [Oceanobacillus neutriphilus]
MKIKLEDVIDTIEMATDGVEHFYNIETGEIIFYSEMMFSMKEQRAFKDELEMNQEKYVRFPDQFEVSDYDIMESFIYALPEGKIQDELEEAIRGRGAFRRFKDKVQDVGLEEKWFSYRDNEYRQIAINWCEENGIEFVSKR